MCQFFIMNLFMTEILLKHFSKTKEAQETFEENHKISFF